MKTLVACSAVVLAVGLYAFSRFAPWAGVADAPPVVIKTVPVAGSSVDPKLSEVRITFSKKMMDKSWSWSTATSLGEPIPGTAAPRYLDDGRTCVMPVKLEPGKAYATWLNSQNFGNFKDAAGNSAVPYLLVFETRK